MRVEILEEPVAVIGLFRNGTLKPLRFQWRGRTVPVRHVASHWATRSGTDQEHFFSVSDNGVDYYELSFHTRTFQWRIEKVFLEG